MGTFPHTSTCFPSRSPAQSFTVQVWRSRFFHIWACAKVSSSTLKSSKIARDATRIILLLDRLRATVSRRGSSRNLLDASR